MFLFWFMLGLMIVITTFGIGTALNMLTKRWWMAPLLYLLFSIYIVLSAVLRSNLASWVWFVFGVGWVGTLLAVWTVNALKKRGYPLFS